MILKFTFVVSLTAFYTFPSSGLQLLLFGSDIVFGERGLSSKFNDV